MQQPDPKPPQSVPHLIGLLAHRVRSDFQEMPGLCLTDAQGARLWSIERHICAAILDALVLDGFLLKTRGGVYRRGT